MASNIQVKEKLTKYKEENMQLNWTIIIQTKTWVYWYLKELNMTY